MDKLKFKNSLYAIIFVACFVTGVCVIGCIICVLATCILEQSKDLELTLIIFACSIISIWAIAGFAILFGKTVFVSSTEISMYRGKKLKWSIKKEEIDECIYTQIHWYNCFFPLSTFNAYALQFKIGGKISKKSCSLSSKQVKEIQKKFDYPIRIINNISEQ